MLDILTIYGYTLTAVLTYRFVEGLISLWISMPQIKAEIKPGLDQLRLQYYIEKSEIVNKGQKDFCKHLLDRALVINDLLPQVEYNPHLRYNPCSELSLGEVKPLRQLYYRYKHLEIDDLYLDLDKAIDQQPDIEYDTCKASTLQDDLKALEPGLKALYNDNILEIYTIRELKKMARDNPNIRNWSRWNKAKLIEELSKYQ